MQDATTTSTTSTTTTTTTTTTTVGVDEAHSLSRALDNDVLLAFSSDVQCLYKLVK